MPVNMSINAVCLLPIIIRFSGSKGTTNSSFSNKGGWSQRKKGVIAAIMWQFLPQYQE
jgi:hypothetical protein